MTRVPARGRDTSIPNLENQSKFPMKSKSHDHISKKYHIFRKKCPLHNFQAFDSLSKHLLCCQGELLQILKRPKKNHRQKPSPNIFGQWHLSHIKSQLGQLNPHSKIHSQGMECRAERDISTFVETQAVLLSPGPSENRRMLRGSDCCS